MLRLSTSASTTLSMTVLRVTVHCQAERSRSLNVTKLSVAMFRHPELVSGSREMLKQVQHDDIH